MKSIQTITRRISLINIVFVIKSLFYCSAQTVIYKDSVPDFLTDYSGNLTVAEVAPVIEFSFIRRDEGIVATGYSHWGNVVLGPDSKFYYAIGNHISNGIVILKSFNPKINTDEICIFSSDVEGLNDGKWHGRPTINPSNGDMYLIGFYQGQVVKYNIFSKQVINFGQAGEQGWEEHIWDNNNNRLYGVGSQGKVLVFNTETNEVITSQQPFEGIDTDRRARMIDDETGTFYATCNSGEFYKYDPEANKFSKLNSTISSDLRAANTTKETDGSFWICSSDGNLYKFFPDKDRLDSKGLLAETSGYYTFIERSPMGNYLYYMAASPDGNLIQYNTNNGDKKVIACLSDFYNEKYKFTIGSCYGGALSKDGSSIFLVCNGRLEGLQVPAFFYVHIPQTERDMENFLDKFKISELDLHAAPNPFYQATNILFTLAHSRSIILKIFTIEGKILYQHQGFYQAGDNRIQWAPGSLPDGTYLYYFETGLSVKTGKLIVKK